VKKKVNIKSNAENRFHDIDNDNKEDEEDSFKENDSNECKRLDDKSSSFDQESNTVVSKGETAQGSKTFGYSNSARAQSKIFNYSPETTDYDSNYGDYEFENDSPSKFQASNCNILSFSNKSSTKIVPSVMPSATVDLSGGPISNIARYCASMPVLEDGLSSGASDSENNNFNHVSKSSRK
jgi:hypothetical protein